MKGKHAAIAARRQAEAATAVAERLADKNAELRLRTRQVETDAAMVPALRGRIRELEVQIEESAFPRVRALEDALEAQRAEFVERHGDLHAAAFELASWSKRLISELRILVESWKQGSFDSDAFSDALLAYPQWANEALMNAGIAPPEVGGGVPNRSKRRLVSHNLDRIGLSPQDNGLLEYDNHSRRNSLAQKRVQLARVQSQVDS